jgi:predicted TIM-barrel fold metal-dependent hydrolase
MTPLGQGAYFDANSWLGEWPSRRLNGSPPPARDQLVAQRLRQMDRLGIARAAVSLLESAWLKDAGVANAELHALAGGLPERFFPVYTLDPTFPTWREHLARCRQEYGLAPGSGAIRLLPGYHGYQLEAAGACLDELIALDLPVVLTLQLEDARMHHPGMQVPDLSPAAAAGALRRWPAARWVVANAITNQILAIHRELAGEGLPPRAWFDIARVQGPVDCVRLLCDQVGAGRLLFGTNAPLHVPESPIMELADARLPAEDDAAIRRDNARAALGM